LIDWLVGAVSMTGTALCRLPTCLIF